MKKTMPALPAKLRAVLPSAARVGGVDRERGVIRGYVVAQLGAFKSDGRGEFDQRSLEEIIKLWPAAGLKVRFAHPNESSDGLGKYLGRAKDPYLGTATVDRDGVPTQIPAVRADLHLDPTSRKTPSGDLGGYVLDLAASDPGAISSSLVLTRDEEFRVNPDGTPQLSPAGDPLPPLWRPKRLYASDIVEEGDAVDGLLEPTSRRYTRDYLSRGEAILNDLFAGQPAAVVRARCLAYLGRYLSRRFEGKGMSNWECLGANLGGVLDSCINSAVTDERPREVILAEMAQASGMEVSAVVGIINGDDAGVTMPVLQSFATVLGCPMAEMVAAAEADGIVLTDGAAPAPPAEGGDSSAPAAPADPAAMSTKILRRKLEQQAARLK